MLPLRKLAVLLVALALANTANANAQRTRYNFNPGWLLKTGDDPAAANAPYNDAKWQHVTLPHAWNEDFAYRQSIHDQPTGIAWYRKHFTVPSIPQGGKVFVEFEGVRQAAEVYLNGHLLGLSENGVMAFGFDLTPFLLPQDNVLAVRTDNSWDYKERATGTLIQWNNRNFYSNFGGINKNVWLHVTPAIYQTLPLYSSLGTTGQYIWADAFDQATHTATVHIESQARNDSAAPAVLQLRAEMTDREGKRVATITSAPTTLAPNALTTLTAQISAKGLHFWSWGYGYLYNVTTMLLFNGKPTDAVTTRTGFRQTAFHDGMIFLNGRVLQIHGYAARTTNEWPALGTDVPPWVSDFSNGLMVEDNANLVRWMHVTPSRQDVESCDRVGLLQSMPAGDAEGDPKGRQWQARVELMRDSIIYNRNNPSILFYESGNKGISETHMQDMLAVRNEFDPHGGRLIGSREMLDSKVAEYGGEMLYVNKSANKPVWAHEYNRDEGARAFWDDQTPPFHKDSPLYNRNQDSFTLEDVYRWDDYFRARPGTGKRVSAGGVNISWIDENSHFRGDNNYRRSGEVDAMRIPKDAFYAHQVMWDGWVEPEHPRVHISGHWNYPTGATRTIYIEANTATVELKLNGHSLGTRHPTNDFLFVFENIPYEPGQLVATAYDAQHRAVAHAKLETAGAPKTIRLTPHQSPTGLHADGSDLALVDVEILDAQGRRVPTAFNLVHFTLQGPAEWRGGIAQGTANPAPLNTERVVIPGMSTPPLAPFLFYDNYILSRDLPVEGGINRVSIRSTTTAGTIKLIARSEGLPDATLTLASISTPTNNGLTTYDPAQALPTSLRRGPTPTTPSYTVTRVPLIIASATAGANPNDATLSYDDNENTGWGNVTSSPNLKTAWIEYTLAKPASPTELDLKLGNFRLNRYPLRITLDGQSLYEATTPTSLGYVTLPLRPARPGTKLCIELTAPSFDVEEKHALVEVSGKIDQAKPRRTRNIPTLNILEAEIYAKPEGR